VEQLPGYATAPEYQKSTCISYGNAAPENIKNRIMGSI
jgi:hypothetical protein